MVLKLYHGVLSRLQKATWQASVNTQSLIASNGALAVSTPRHLNGVNASLPLEKGNTYHIILNIDASTFEPQLEFGFWDGNRKLYEYYVHKSDTVITYTFKPQETKTYRINLRMRQAGYEGEAQIFYVKNAAIHQYQVKVSEKTKGGSSHIYDFHARQYAPALGRFWSVDPLADHSNQVDKSPYAAFWNNPIIFTDPDGRCPDCPDPSTANEGDIVNPNGGMDFIFTNGEWTGIGGTLNEVTVTASRSENNGGFGSGFADGFGAGIGSTVDFFKSLGTTQGWKDLGQGMLDMAMLSCQTCPEGMMMRAQMADRTINYIQNIPNMSAYEMGYDLGFGTEKLAEAVLISKGAGFGINAARYGLGEAMWQSSALGSRSLLFGRYHSQFVPNGRRGVLNTGIQTGIGWSNHGSRHVFRAKYNGTKIFQIYK